MNQWLIKYSELKFLSVLEVDILNKAGAGKESLHCRNAITDPIEWRQKRNDKWVEKELQLKQDLLDTLLPTKLSRKQREAIVRHDNRVLAVAGAGTGKTTTVVGKVAYLLSQKICKPEEILLLSFAKGAVDELQERIEATCGNGVQVQTFHKLGLDVIIDVTGKKPAIYEQDDLINFIQNHLSQMLMGASDNEKILEFLAYYFYPTKLPNEFNTQKEYLKHVSSHDIRTLKGEKVKSYQEAQVANFLFLHGIEYIYEAKYRGADTGNTQKRVYKPDFYLPKNGIYIEHFGVDRNNNTAPWVDRYEYLESMQWKRELHSRNGTTLVQTYSYQASEGNLANALHSQLKKHNVQFMPINQAYLFRLKEIKSRLKSVAKLLGTTLTLFKSDKMTLKDLSEEIYNTNKENNQREKRFLRLFKHVLSAYENHLDIKGEIDFGDMITKAAAYVEDGKFESPYKVIVVDEFQDISRGRAWFLNSLLEQVKDARLLCVGDDWQSIYRFTGSDISLMTNYKEQWSQAVRIDLDKTYRFNDKIKEVSTKFITKNPSQLSKNIICDKKREHPAVYVTQKQVSDIYNEIRDKDSETSVLVLNRYNFGADNVEIDKVGDVDLRNLTVHSAKGKEADYVIVDNLESGKYGFPSEILDDPIINLFLIEKESYPNSEERRLFYVALTRARKEVWLKVNASFPSQFVEELRKDDAYTGLVIDEENSILTDYSCPICDSTVIERRNSKDNSLFFGCIHYPRCTGTIAGCPKCKSAVPIRSGNKFICPSETCDWQAPKCPVCDNGYRETKTGPYGKFKVCSMYSVTGCKGK
nr:UvrD-helicase domain-containing protein [Rhodohalobacter sulfatireducens]